MAMIRPQTQTTADNRVTRSSNNRSNPLTTNLTSENYGYGYGVGAGTISDPIKLPQGITDLRIKGSNFDSNAELQEWVSSSSNTSISNTWNRLPATFLTNPLRLRVQYVNGIPFGLRAYKIVQNGLESNALYIQVEADEISEPKNPIINAVGANSNVFELNM